MFGNHTAEADDRIDALMESDIARIWADLDLLGNESDTDKWKDKMEQIAREYLLSSRFALMRILHNRGSADFGDVSMEQALSLSPRDHIACIRCLQQIAGPSPEEEPDLHESLIARAWHDEVSANAVAEYCLREAGETDPRRFRKQLALMEKENRKKYSTSLTREEALKLGHILHFSLEEIQWYLMRVFDQDEALRMNRSADLIEAYCFLTDGSCRQAQQLKLRYPERTAGTNKLDNEERSRNWTRQTGSGLIQCVESWKRYPQTMEENFLTWLADRSSGLDLPSRSALRLYRNLAAYAYAGEMPEEGDLLDELIHIFDMDEDSEEALACLYCDGVLSEEQCDRVADHLYWENKTISDPDVKDNTKAWSVITTRRDRELSVSYGTVNSSRTRIQSLLMGREEVEKADLLYLLWFTFNLAWSDSFETDHNVLYNRLFDLKDAANILLENALLPAFYPPHLMEQSLMLSIIYAGKTGTDPSVTYGAMLQSLRETRARVKKSGKHSLQEQIDIITHYRSAGLTLNQCALLYGISEQSISRWQKELIEKGHIPPTV